MKTTKLLLTGVLFLFCLSAWAVPSPTETQAAVAASEDVSTPDALIRAVYEVISGPKGEERDWNRFRSLFAPDARMAAVRSRPESKEAPLTVMTPEDYVSRSGAWLEENGFIEIEVARKEERFGHVLHAFSTYEARHAEEEAEPFMTGINSFQLVHDGERWWVHSILWEAAHAELPIPEVYRAR